MFKCRFHQLYFTLLVIGMAEVLLISCEKAKPRILVFSKTEGYRHADAIDAGYQVLFTQAKEKGFIVDSTEDATRFNDENLKQYQAVVFLNVSGALFNKEQRTSLKRFVQAGGGFLATHASTDAERDWPWYNRLIGAYFYSHGAVQNATYKKVNAVFEASRFLPDTFAHVDEHYNFMKVDSGINLLVTVDEKTFEGGNMGAVHPIVWYHEFDGGRSYYNGMGHTKETWSDPRYLEQFWAALKWVTGGDEPQRLDYARAVPEEDRFTRIVLAEKLDEPMQMAIAKDSRVFIAERRGNVQVYDPKTKAIAVAGSIPVLSQYEDGLLGIALDPEFDKNNWIYLFYAEAGLADTTSNYHISRFVLDGSGKLNVSSEKVLLKIPHRNADGIHTGGALMFDPRGNGDLFITVGDNTSPRATPYTPIDEREGRELFNAQRSASNTNDLRGKILRIHPEPDGSYSIPEGNLFPKGAERTRPEIYSMGHRQPWRLSMDTKTGWLYEGEVGPDSRIDSSRRGPASVDEFNQIRKPGNYGWPYFVGDNKAYWSYDFATELSGERFDPAHPQNHSRLNTGMTDIPPAQPALLYYPYAESPKFPEMGTGGRSAVGGPIFRKADYENAKNTFPAYYEGKWFITEWLRNWILVVTMDEEGHYKSMERFLPDLNLAGPMDIQFGPDGSFYILEYGKGWFRANDDARLVRIDYNGGNRKPVAAANANHLAGALPLKVNLTSEGSKDADRDELQYEWKITSPSGFLQVIKEPNPAIVFDQASVYTATLTVKDSKGDSSSSTVAITAGNAAPVIHLDVKSNKTFYFPGQPIDYAVNVTDKEDGTTTDGRIAAENVKVSIDYFAGGYDQLLGDPVAGQFENMDFKILFGGLKLNSSDCYSCHSISKKSIGPTFKAVAEKYAGDANAPDKLVKKIIAGGGGVWGQAAMSAHPDLPPADAKSMVDFILSLSGPAEKPSLPLQGSFPIGQKSEPKGAYVVKVSYTDRGARNIPAVTTDSIVVLRYPQMLLSSATLRKGSMNIKTPATGGQVELLVKTGDHMGFANIDLTGIDGIEVLGTGTGKMEIHLDAPGGPAIAGFVLESTPASSAGDQSNPLSNMQRYKAKLPDVAGIHNVYLVLNGNFFMMKDSVTFISDK